MTAFHIAYRYELLDRDDALIGDLEGHIKRSGEHAESAANQVHTSAQVALYDTGQVEHWSQVRIKPYVSVNGDEWALGVFVPSVPRWEHTGGERIATIALTDKTILLQRDYFGLTGTGVPSGMNIVDSVREIIESTGETNIALSESDATLNAAVEWEPDKNKLTSTNVLLDASNFFSLWCDGHGQFQVTPYRSPQSRGVATHFVEGKDGVRLPDHGVYRPEFTTEQDLDRIPNVYQAISATEGDEEALFAEAVNDDPNDPLSTVNRGRVMPDGGPEFNVATSGQVALQAYANRKLIELALPSLVVTIHTPPRRLKFNDVVTFTSTRHGISGRFVVSNIRAKHTHGQAGLWQVTLRKVADNTPSDPTPPVTP